MSGQVLPLKVDPVKKEQHFDVLGVAGVVVEIPAPPKPTTVSC